MGQSAHQEVACLLCSPRVLSPLLIDWFSPLSSTIQVLFLLIPGRTPPRGGLPKVAEERGEGPEHQVLEHPSNWVRCITRGSLAGSPHPRPSLCLSRWEKCPAPSLKYQIPVGSASSHSEQCLLPSPCIRLYSLLHYNLWTTWNLLFGVAMDAGVLIPALALYQPKVKT